MMIPDIWIIFGIVAIVSWLISHSLKNKFRNYSSIPTNGYLSGREVALKMLHENGIYDVEVVSVEGELTDHYNPIKKTVNLSRDVYEGRHIAAAAVAAHECGHAIQHAQAYSWLKLRTALVPVVNFASMWVQWVLFAGVLLVETLPEILLLGIILFSTITLFSFITLPVEIDASRRALQWLNNAGITTYSSHDKAKDALRTAAYTYVVAALGSLATLIYYILILLGSRRND